MGGNKNKNKMKVCELSMKAVQKWKAGTKLHLSAQGEEKPKGRTRYFSSRRFWPNECHDLI